MITDISGKRFGRLIAIEPMEERRHGQVVWKCQCDCGKLAYVITHNLNKGITKSCGCINANKKTEMIGKRFGQLTVIKQSDKKTSNGMIIWECMCDCGNLTYVRTDYLKSGHTKSCGCLHGEKDYNRTLSDAYWDARLKKWEVKLIDKGKRYCLGFYERYSDAMTIRNEAETERAKGRFIDWYLKVYLDGKFEEHEI